MSGWVPMDALAWDFIAGGLAKPWPREAVLFDLRWWADQARMGYRDRPGRPFLAERWGWTERRVRTVLGSDVLWRDPRGPQEGGVQRPSSERPASVQEASSERPVGEPSEADNSPEMSSERPASVQEASSERPASVQALPESAGSSIVIQTITPHHTTPQTEEQESTSGSRLADQVQRVVDAYRKHHPRAAAKASASDAEKIRARVKDTATRYSVDHDTAASWCCWVVEWMHLGPDGWYRGENPRGQKYLGFDTAFKADKWDTRLEAARAWKDPRQEPETSDPAAAWTDLKAALRRLPNPTDMAAYRAAVESLPHDGAAFVRAHGGAGKVRERAANPFEEKGLFQAFCQHLRRAA